jgi:phenylacetyl-CoA:acceptor oxidoreductase subunit 2
MSQRPSQPGHAGKSGRIAPWHQSNWDLRAAGNFVFGGAGTGLIVFAGIGHAFGAAYVLPALIGLALVGAGLLCVWAEIGRPLRAVNVYLHPQSSWMTREAMVAPLLFASGLAAAWTGRQSLIWTAAALALVYLTCQAQMIKASRGIPAWRSPRMVPLAMLTGLCEGASLAILVAAATADHGYLKWIEAFLLALALGRGLAWYAYRSGLQHEGAPAKALAALARIELPFSILGNWVPLVLLFIALASSSANVIFWLGVTSALAVLGSGWLFKVVLITRAAYNQGFALPRLPVRGSGSGGPATKPGWH